MIVEIKTVENIKLSRGLEMMVIKVKDANHFVFEVDDEEEIDLLLEEIEELSKVDQWQINK